MSEWITLKEAAERYGVTSVIVYNYARRHNLEKRTAQDPQLNHGHKFSLYRADQIASIAGSAYLQRHAQSARLVKWVDSLEEWPSDEEIVAHFTESYRFRDIVGCIENRVYRGLSKLEPPEGWEMPGHLRDVTKEPIRTLRAFPGAQPKEEDEEEPTEKDLSQIEPLTIIESG